MSDRDDLIRVYEALRETRDQLARVTRERDEARADRDGFDAARIALVEENERLLQQRDEAVMALEFYATMHEASSYYNGEVARKALAAIREGDGK